jgi:small subunit ribosomal protein S16
VAVKIKLKRVGKIHAPQYRVVIADSRKRRDGRAIEEVGIYQPLENPSLIRIDSQRIQYWLGVGAQPTDSVLALLKITGDWQRFKGLPGAEGTLQVAPEKPSRSAMYEKATAEAADEPKTPVVKPVTEKAVEEAVVETVVEEAVVEAVVEEAVAEAEVVAEAEQIVDAAADEQAAEAAKTEE